MRKLITILSFVSLIISCSPTKKLSSEANTPNTVSVVSGEDGSSFGKAIVIKEKNESVGVDAEYAWLRKHYPGYRLKGQSLLFQKETPYDIIDIVTASGEEKKVYFNISNFYGKF